MRSPTLLEMSLECRQQELPQMRVYRNVVVAGVSVDIHVIGDHRESMRLPIGGPSHWVPFPVSRKVAMLIMNVNMVIVVG